MGLKSPKTRRRMEKRLMTYVQRLCNREEVKLLKSESLSGRFYFHFSQEEIKKAMKLFPYIIGLHSFAPAYKTSKDFDILSRDILNFAETFLEDGDTFAIRSRRVKPYPFTSMQIDRKIGSIIYNAFEAQNKKLIVDLTHPKKTIFIEIRQENTYFYTTLIPTFWGGNPIEGDKPMLLLWEKKDTSELASMLMIRRGSIPIPIIFNSSYTIGSPLIHPSKELSSIDNKLKMLALYFPEGLPSGFLNVDPLISYIDKQEHLISSNNKNQIIHVIILSMLEKIILYINHSIRFYYNKRKLWIKGIISPVNKPLETNNDMFQSFSRPVFFPLIGFHESDLDTYNQYYKSINNNQQNRRISFDKIIDRLTQSSQPKPKIQESNLSFINFSQETVKIILQDVALEKIIKDIIQNGVYQKIMHKIL